MLNIKELYRKNVYGVMGTLIFHILLIGGFLLAELNINGKIEKEEPITIDFSTPEELLVNKQAQPLTESQKDQQQQSPLQYRF